MTSCKALPERMLSFDRWQKLLAKAWEEGIVIYPHPSRPALGITFSRTSLRSGKAVFYTVGVYGCSCAARGDCKHRALFLFERPALLPLAVELPVALTTNGDAPVVEDTSDEYQH